MFWIEGLAAVERIDGGEYATVATESPPRLSPACQGTILSCPRDFFWWQLPMDRSAFRRLATPHGVPAPSAKAYTSRSLNSGLLLMTSRTNPHSGSTVRLRRRTS